MASQMLHLILVVLVYCEATAMQDLDAKCQGSSGQMDDCCYLNTEGFPIGSTIRTSNSEDSCDKTSLVCVEKNDRPEIVREVTNLCPSDVETKIKKNITKFAVVDAVTGMGM
eukprot:GFUD01009709.1.p1 GENE.GFUD01009709.1~~GFUD01009709.1.p1  ORF type:complete len:112 (+),score=27.51 GFUD01009709.1:51-386(+)